MSAQLERFLIVYFRVLALSCGARKRSLQRLLSAFLALVLVDLVVQVWCYSSGVWLTNVFQTRQHQQFRFYVRIIDVMNLAYLLTHISMVVQALLWRNRERRLLLLLPKTESDQINVRFHLTLECLVSGGALLVVTFSSMHELHLVTNLRYLYSTQAVRARYLQMALFVLRLDAQLVTLQQQLGQGRRSSIELRSRYAHLVRLSQQISQLFGFSIVLMNLLCIGDFIVVCYSYIVLWQFTDATLSWMLSWQAVYVVMPALVNVWTLCAACHKCANHEKRTRYRTRTTRNMVAMRNEANEFALQIMQNPVQFDVCGIYTLNLNTLAGMCLFILQSLVIFLQFVELIKQQIN
ncbi:hypothetical protein KR222_011691 [Zaprionus bogoriensis]|nr:hypothetical protein KR222_011691 [Zaprionus bogoriensis]